MQAAVVRSAALAVVRDKLPGVSLEAPSSAQQSSAPEGRPPTGPRFRPWLEAIAATAPAPLSSGQVLAVWIAAFLIVPTRIYARSAAIWDWDESLFILGVRNFDVGSHHPHPPGFPLYMILAKVLNRFTPTEQIALQTINILAAATLFPLLFYFARELRFSFFTAFAGSLLTVFLPNVWFYGGTALTDVPALAMIVGAMLLMLAGARRSGAAPVLWGCFLYGASTGMRAQNVLIGAAAFAVSAYVTAGRSRIRALWGFVVAASTSAALTIGAALVTGWSRYWWVVKQHQIYISTHDSVFAPGRQQLTSIMELFFVREPGAGPISWIIFFLVLAGLIRSLRSRSGPAGFLAATFVPFAIFAWLMLDMWSAHRFSIGYIPLVTILAAEGVVALTAFSSPRAAYLRIALTCALILALVVWTVPALKVVRSTPSPQTAAASWIRATFPAARWAIVETHGMAPFVDALLPDYRSSEVSDSAALPRERSAVSRLLLTEHPVGLPQTTLFSRPHGRIWNIGTHRYYEVAVTRMDAAALDHRIAPRQP